MKVSETVKLIVTMTIAAVLINLIVLRTSTKVTVS